MEIIRDAPLGSAAITTSLASNLCYFRTLEYKEYGFHKPVMLAGGIGSIKEDQIKR